MRKTLVKGLILMGGQSVRMGTDKAFVKWQGKTLLERAIESLSGITEDVYLSVNAEQYHRLQSNYNCILDKYPDQGPMGGILSALEQLDNDLIVLAVDMPNLNKKTISNLLDSIKQPDRVSCYQHNDSIQPFPSYWSTQLLPKVESSLQANHLSVIRLIQDLQPNFLNTEDIRPFKNLNSLADFS